MTPLNGTARLAELLAGRTLLLVDCDAELSAAWCDAVAESGIVTQRVHDTTEAFSALIRPSPPAAVVCSLMLVADLIEAFPNTPICMVAEQASDVPFLPAGVTHWVSSDHDGRCLTECLIDIFSTR